jgi:hypothetical protein
MSDIRRRDFITLLGGAATFRPPKLQNVRCLGEAAHSSSIGATARRWNGALSPRTADQERLANWRAKSFALATPYS